MEQSFDYFYRHQDREIAAGSKQRLALENHELNSSQVNIGDLDLFKMEVERLYRPIPD
jgi:hypothetical protein